MEDSKRITTIQQMQAIELGIMKKVHDFCVDNNIRYWLSCGTLLGAIRHNGFIPWDDDIDISMMRKDYDRFLELFPLKEKELGLTLASPYSKEHYYPHEMSKVSDARTILIEQMVKIDSDIGVCIDIFPVDNVPNGKKKAQLFRLRSKVLRRLLFAGNTNLKNDAYKSHYNFPKRVMLHLLQWVPVSWTMKRLEKHAAYCKDDNSEYVMNVEGEEQRLYRREWFHELQLHDFEDTRFFIPAEYDQVLKKGFGDYMKLPPEEQRQPHHVVNVWYR